MNSLDQAIRESQPQTAGRRPVPPDQAQALDEFCRALRAALAGERQAVAALLGGLAAVRYVAQSPLHNLVAASDWQAQLRPDPQLGGSELLLEDRAAGQKLRFHLDEDQKLYLGSWQSEAEALAFQIVPALTGWELLLETGGPEKRLPLGARLAGPGWTASPRLSPPQAEAGGLKGLGRLFGDLLRDAGQAVLEEVQDQALEAAVEKMSAAGQAQAEACTRCGAGNPAGSHYCGNCGAVLAPAACRVCGAPLKPGNKFCTRCGRRV